MNARPVIDYNRCEGKGVCTLVCPWQVFELRQLSAAERGPLTPWGRLRAWLHGAPQSVPVRAEACHGCGRCVAECPEEAIRLQRD